jgi:hypothetical protein
MNTALEIDLPHGTGASLDLDMATIDVAEDVRGSCRLAIADRSGRRVWSYLLPAERRWLAAELLFGLEEEQG